MPGHDIVPCVGYAYERLAHVGIGDADRFQQCPVWRPLDPFLDLIASHDHDPLQVYPAQYFKAAHRTGTAFIIYGEDI
jgi:hypothetical protein